MNDSKGKTHLLLRSERIVTAKTGNVHYIRAWRRERYINEGKWEFECFILSHSTDSGLYYEEKYKDLSDLARRKAQLLHYWRKKST